MTFAELTAAIWDQREITMRDWDGREIRCVPKGVKRCVNDDDSVEWEVLYEEFPQGPMVRLYAVLDAFDGHTGETA